MMNKNPKTENLIPLNQLTKVEQRKIQSAGGKKSAKARQEKVSKCCVKKFESYT